MKLADYKPGRRVLVDGQWWAIAWRYYGGDCACRPVRPDGSVDTRADSIQTLRDDVAVQRAAELHAASTAPSDKGSDFDAVRDGGKDETDLWQPQRNSRK